MASDYCHIDGFYERTFLESVDSAPRYRCGVIRSGRKIVLLSAVEAGWRVRSGIVALNRR